MSQRYLGMREGDLAGKPYAQYWNPAMRPLSEEARDAILRGPIAPEVLPPLKEVAASLDVPSGYAMLPGGGAHVAIRTAMPGVSPRMTDWWFAWHGEEAERYKLWHPRAHVHAAWAEPSKRAGYVGRTSLVDEYIGSTLGSYAIRFVDPRELGLMGSDDAATAVCARVGYATAPLDFGWLVHVVRNEEMRSRFWLGGPYAAARGFGAAGALAVSVATRIVKPSREDARDLLVHCAEEMAHLASFLPRLYEGAHDAEKS
jgi:hypothetical protein